MPSKAPFYDAFTHVFFVQKRSVASEVNAVLRLKTDVRSGCSKTVPLKQRFAPTSNTWVANAAHITLTWFNCTLGSQPLGEFYSFALVGVQHV